VRNRQLVLGAGDAHVHQAPLLLDRALLGQDALLDTH